MLVWEPCANREPSSIGHKRETLNVRIRSLGGQWRDGNGDVSFWQRHSFGTFIFRRYTLLLKRESLPANLPTVPAFLHWSRKIWISIQFAERPREALGKGRFRGELNVGARIRRRSRMDTWLPYRHLIVSKASFHVRISAGVALRRWLQYSWPAVTWFIRFRINLNRYNRCVRVKRMYFQGKEFEVAALFANAI